MIKLLRILPVLCLALTFCSSPQKKTEIGHVHTKNEIVIIATTDFHAAFERAEGLANVVQSQREKFGDQLIFVDAGDLFQGSLEGDLDKGVANVRFFNLLGLEVAALGNHEFDFGVSAKDHIMPRGKEDPRGNLKDRIAEANFKWISANWVLTSKKPVLLPHAIIEKNEMRTCFVGATTPTTAGKVPSSFLSETEFLPLKSTVESEARKLRSEERCDFVILLAHAGLSCTPDHKSCHAPGPLAEILELAESLAPGTLDAIIGGHTHERAQEIINGIPVLQAGSRGEVLGTIHLLKQGEKAKFAFDPFIEIPLNASHAPTTTLLKPYRDQANQIKNTPAGSSLEVFEKNIFIETALGNLLADATFQYALKHGGADFALVQPGTLRYTLPAGGLKYGDIVKTLPFSNPVATVSMRGDQIRTLIEIAASGAHGLGLIAGLSVRLRKMPEARDLNKDGKMEMWEQNLVEEVFDSNGRPLNPKKTYRLATNDYLIFGGDHQDFIYKQIPETNLKVTYGPIMRDVLRDYILAHSPLKLSSFYNPEQPRYSR